MRLVLSAVALTVAAGGLAAQDTTATPKPGNLPVPGTPRCNGEQISVVTINRQEPVVVERSVGFVRPFLRFALAGAPTRETAIAPFLLVRQGDVCTETKLAESERLLRAQPYLTDAHAVVTPDTAGTVQVEFATIDDIRPIISLNFKGGSPTRVKLGSANFAGYGMLGSAQWQQGFAFRDGWAVRFVNYHTFGRPYLFDMQLERAPLGEVEAATLSHPLYTQLQKVAWAGTAARVDRYQSFVRGDDVDALSLDVDRQSWQVNTVYRIGGGQNGVFAGAEAGGDRVVPADEGVIITKDGFVADPDTTLGARYQTQNRAVIAAILGARALYFFKAEGFDALEGAQDVANGLQVGGLFGRGFGANADGWTGGGQVYGGAGTPKSFVGIQWSLESSRVNGDWSDVLTEGRLAWYWRPTKRRTQIASFEYAGGWSTTVPYQLQLGTAGVGIRGYEGSRTGGGRRAVARLEERWLFGGIKKYAGIGGAAFVDAGKMWAGDVPFGQTVNPRVGAGLGLILAIPRSSRQNLRVDVAAPLVPDPGAKWGVRFSISAGRPRFYRPAPDLARARSAAQTPVVFGWP